MALQFIDQTPGGVGSSTRRLIRSHVMQGKNKGKQRRPTEKPKNAAELKCPLDTAGAGYMMPRQVLWGDLCLVSFPQQLDSASLGLMHRWFFDISDALFPPQFCTKFDIIKSVWVNCILADEAYFHSTLAISASYVEFLQRKPAISSKTLHHISQAYALVNVKLSSPSAVTDSAIAAVVSLVIYQQVHYQPETGLVHLNGLYRMIQLRGGISRLIQENRALALKPLRLDIELAMQNGTQTLFSGEQVPIRPVLCRLGTENVNFAKDATWMPVTMTDLISFARLLNKTEKKQSPKLNPLDYTETLLSLLYRIIDASSSRRASVTADGPFRNMINLSMLAFMTTLLPEYTRDQSSCPLLACRLEIAIRDICATALESSELDLPFLWVLFIGGISVLNIKDHHWLSSSILRICKRLQLDNWVAIQQEISQFPWIFALHETPGRLLWERCMA